MGGNSDYESGSEELISLEKEDKLELNNEVSQALSKVLN